jgi:general secretion pathway protein D
MITYSTSAFAAKDVAKLVEQAVRTPSSGTPPADDRFRIVVDDLTGNLLVTASPAQHETVRALIKRLESTPAAARRPARSFVVKNRPVREVQAILEELLQAGVIEAGAESTTPPPGAPGTTSSPNTAAPTDKTAAPLTTPMPPPPSASSSQAPARPLLSGGGRSGSGGTGHPRSESSPLVLTCDEATNTLMAVGEPRLLNQIETLLRTLDVRQPQVMLEVLMVTLSEGQTLDLGVELEKIEINGDLRARLSSLFGLGTRSSGGDRDGPSDALGFTGVVLSPGDFSVIVRALETLNKGRSVSMPRLLVGNNQSASFDSVVQQPYASVNASNTVSTTSFGGSQDAGTVVTIKPQIAEGDHLLLEYSVSLSAFLGSASSPTLPPPKQQNRVQSIATIPDGHTVVVGGIEVENRSNTTSQVPFIGNIPIIGEAFKSRNNLNNRSHFYVFVRANILRSRSFEDLKYISEEQALAAQVDDGWPKVEPSVIP